MRRLLLNNSTTSIGTVCIMILCLSCNQQAGKNDSKNTNASHVDSVAVPVEPDAGTENMTIANDSLPADTFEYMVMQPADEFWKRGVFFESENEKVKLIHVKVNVVDNFPTFYFIGAERPQIDDTIQYGHIYELNTDDAIHVVDSFPILASFSEWIGYPDNDAFNDFVNRNFDNLIINDSVLYYYKENDYTRYNRESKTFSYNRTYYMYIMGSKQTPVEVDSDLFHYTNRMKLHSLERAVFSPDKKMLAYTNTYEILFKHIDDWKWEVNSAYAKGTSFIKYNTANGDFKLLDYFEEYAPKDNLCDSEALFGGMCWHDTKPILYFDNSGECYACIWMIDVTTREVTKIVPEHEAIHPCYFSIDGKDFVAYVYENQIRICEP